MTPERFRRIEEIYHAACEHRPEEWGAFLDGACQGEPEMRQRIERMLEPGSGNSDLLDRPAAERLGEITEMTQTAFQPPEPFQRIEDLYHAARERVPPERADFLAGACGADSELRREVESLLADDAEEGNEHPAFSLAD